MVFQIKQGLRINIEKATPVQGCWYVTTDTNELYFCADGQHIVKVNSVESFDPTPIYNRLDSLEATVNTIKNTDNGGCVRVKSTSNLPTTGKDNIVYIVEDENAAYAWRDGESGIHWYCIGRNWEEIEFINGGESNSY